MSIEKTTCPTCGSAVLVAGDPVEGTMHYAPAPRSDVEVQAHFDLMTQQGVEWEAWQAVVAELRECGAGEINAGGRHERLHDLIARWGEELAQLRLADPDPTHAANALRERRHSAERWKHRPG